MTGEPTPIHGLLPRGDQIPSALEVSGRMTRVHAYRPRGDLGLATWQRDNPKSFWDLQLVDGSLHTVYRDLIRGGWFEIAFAWRKEPGSNPAPLVSEG